MTCRQRARRAEPMPLPAPGQRWVIRRKAALIAAVRNNEITLDEACRRYELSPEEFTSWVATIDKHGVFGLRATRFQIYRVEQGGSRRVGMASAPNQRFGTPLDAIPHFTDR